MTASNKPAISIRTYRPGDAGYVAYRHGVLYAKDYGFDHVFEKYVLQSLSTFLDEPFAGEIWMAEVGGVVAGFIGLVEIDKSTAQLRWFLMEPEFRGIGLGRRLMDTLLAHCEQKGYTHILLWTFKGLDAAVHLYQQAGFTLTEEKENHEWKDLLIEQRWDLDLQ
jgi:GNAT superfamily N-acetyltransferase